MARRGEIVGAVDFGSREVRVLIARQAADGAVQIIGHGVAPSRGCVSQGVIQDLSAAQQALKRALSVAEKEAGQRPPALFCGLNGKNVETFIREGTAKLDREIVEVHHLRDALDAASQDIMTPGKRVISSISSQEWYVDDLRVSEPLGIQGALLKARVHFAQLPAVIEDNLLSCIESVGKSLEGIVFLPLAAGLGCLTLEDTELGVAVIDMGRTTTGVAVYRDRRILATHTFEWGGFHITRDVAAGLQVSFEEAAELVLEYGVSPDRIRAEEGEGPEETDAAAGNAARIKLNTAVRGAPPIVDRSELEMIVFERSRELMTKVRQYLHARGLTRHLVRGVVLSGGVAKIKHQDTLAESIFQAPVRIGLPDNIDVLPQQINAPDFVPVVGVLRHGLEYRTAIRSGRIQMQQGPVGIIARSLLRTLRGYFS